MMMYSDACRALGMATLLTLASLAVASEPQPEAKLTEFTSPSGQFSVLLPGEPIYEKTPLAGTSTVQHQYKLGSAEGAYLVSYQENPNLKGSTAEQLASVLESGRDRVVEMFQGEVLETKQAPLAKKYPGLSFRVTIPQAGGEARCRFYMVGMRLYQVMAIGKPSFVASKQSTQILESFQLLP